VIAVGWPIASRTEWGRTPENFLPGGRGRDGLRITDSELLWSLRHRWAKPTFPQPSEPLLSECALRLERIRGRDTRIALVQEGSSGSDIAPRTLRVCITQDLTLDYQLPWSVRRP
jgi:hypothetical protein